MGLVGDSDFEACLVLVPEISNMSVAVAVAETWVVGGRQVVVQEERELIAGCGCVRLTDYRSFYQKKAWKRPRFFRTLFVQVEASRVLFGYPRVLVYLL